MPDFTLHHPKTDETTVTGDPGERARLRARGWRDVTDTGDDTPADDKAADDKPKADNDKPVDGPAPTPAGPGEPGPKSAPPKAIQTSGK